MNAFGLTLTVIGGSALLLGLFGLIPASEDERQAERDAWRREIDMPQHRRYARQRAYVLSSVARPLRVAGAVALVAGIAVLALI